MTDLEKPVETPQSKAARTKKKPPTQTAGVNGIDGHGAMGAAPTEPFQQYINWSKLTGLPAFEMFVFEQSGQQAGASANDWVSSRRASLGDEKLYSLYAGWHKGKGLWVNETPMGAEVEK